MTDKKLDYEPPQIKWGAPVETGVAIVELEGAADAIGRLADAWAGLGRTKEEGLRLASKLLRERVEHLKANPNG